jgi:hypothetical protein
MEEGGKEIKARRDKEKEIRREGRKFERNFYTVYFIEPFPVVW